jgi:aromatic ring hydroxylase
MLMTGKEYLQSIRDGRVIYVGKERVKDQTTHPAFADGAHTYAALFDMKSDSALRDVMTFEEGGERYSMYYLQPRSQEDLRRRNCVHRKIADFCFGLMGRTPDAFAGNYNFINAPWDELHAAVEDFMGTYGTGAGRRDRRARASATNRLTGGFRE